MNNLAISTSNQPTLAEQVTYANTICKAGIIPDSYRNRPADILVAMGFGQSMGLSPAESLYRITVIKGKPTASAELIAANVRRAGHRLRVEKDEASQTATVEIIRADDPEFTFSTTWTMERAKQAGLAGKDNWKKYPLAMLTARAITECARDACPEALYGVVYTGEEMGANKTDSNGAIDVQAYEVPPVPQTTTQTQPQPQQQPPKVQQQEQKSPLARVGDLMRTARNYGFEPHQFKQAAFDEYGCEIQEMSNEQLERFALFVQSMIDQYLQQPQEVDF